MKRHFCADFETTTFVDDCRVWAWGAARVCDEPEETFVHGTDIDGFIYMLRRGEIDPAGAKAVIGPTAQRPALTAAQLSFTVLPVGLTVPRPVMTTLRLLLLFITNLTFPYRRLCRAAVR